MPMVDTGLQRALALFAEKARSTFQVERVLLFGSRARGDAGLDSDVDVAVILLGQRGDIYRVGIQLADLAFDVLMETGQIIAPTPIWEEDWDHPEDYTNPRFIENVRREGISISDGT